MSATEDRSTMEHDRNDQLSKYHYIALIDFSLIIHHVDVFRTHNERRNGPFTRLELARP